MTTIKADPKTNKLIVEVTDTRPIPEAHTVRAEIKGMDGSVVFEQDDVEAPVTWSQRAVNIVASKYFRGALGSDEREDSVFAMVRRVTTTITNHGIRLGYFDEANADTFQERLYSYILNQQCSFNSPVWFNVGVEEHPQCSACFINKVDDTMEDIMKLATTEARLFKGGSGAGVNMSTLRSSKERLTGGGIASGPVSFMRGLDSFAGAVKSGGKNRRAAKMVCLDIDHPDVEKFIECKVQAEKQARALIDAGFDGGFAVEGGAYDAVQFQNANNSVRLTDDFLEAVEDDAPFNLRGKDGKVLDTVQAKELFRKIAQAAWDCGDPGLHYTDTINSMHTCAHVEPINASNPCCFVGQTLIQTSIGPKRIDELQRMDKKGTALPLVMTWDEETQKPVMKQMLRAWCSGESHTLTAVQVDDDKKQFCTPEHRFLLESGEWVEAQQLQQGDRLRGIECDNIVVDTYTIQCSQLVFDIEVEDNHNFYVVDDSGRKGVVAHNSEFVFLDNTACNLASINLRKVDLVNGEFQEIIDVLITAMEIIVGFSSYPTREIELNSHKFRPLGLGYANLGGLLMSKGLPYDSPEGRSLAAEITSDMGGRATFMSQELAKVKGPYTGYHEPSSHVVQHAHRYHAMHVSGARPGEWPGLNEKEDLHNSSRSEEFPMRNAQVTVLAPTGTIGFMMDCDTTGIEPTIALVSYKTMVGGGSMKITNDVVTDALEHLGYGKIHSAMDPGDQIEKIVDYVRETGTIEGAPGLKPEHLPVFDCAFKAQNGERSIEPMGHVRMMAAVQPFLSGAISKTVNLPESATVEDIEDVYLQSWKMGLKAVAVYRDGCKRSQPLSTSDGAEEVESFNEAITKEVVYSSERRRLPDDRDSKTHKFSIAGHEGYITAGLFEDGTLGELFVTMSKQGSTLSGLMDGFATAVSMSLQHGVPLSALVNKFKDTRFEPNGFTGNPQVRSCTSILDYIMKWLEVKFLSEGDASGFEDVDTKNLRPPTTTDTERVEDFNPDVGAPPCMACGSITVRNGSCYKCLNCGETSGCS